MKNHENRPGQGRNKQKRYRHTNRTFLLYIDPIITPLDGGGGRAGISKNVTDKQNLPIIYRSNRNNFGRGRGGRAGKNKNFINAGSQLTLEGGRAGINKNVTNAGSQLTWEGARQE